MGTPGADRTFEGSLKAEDAGGLHRRDSCHRACAWLHCLVPDYFLIFWLSCRACGILVPQPGIKPVPPALGVSTVLSAGRPRKSPLFSNLCFEGSLLCKAGVPLIAPTEIPFQVETTNKEGVMCLLHLEVSQGLGEHLGAGANVFLSRRVWNAERSSASLDRRAQCCSSRHRFFPGSAADDCGAGPAPWAEFTALWGPTLSPACVPLSPRRKTAHLGSRDLLSPAHCGIPQGRQQEAREWNESERHQTLLGPPPLWH